EPYVALRQPVIRSPHDTRPAWRIAKELAAELGVGDQFPWTTFEEYLDVRLRGAGLSLEALRRDGIAKPPRKTPLHLADGEAVHWHTPSGKIELWSQQLADAGFDPLPVWKGPPPPPPGSFRLLYGRSPLHTFGRTQNNPILSDLDPENVLWMSPKAAAALGLSAGEPVVIANAHGSETTPLPLKVTERMPDDAVYLVHGFGHWSAGLSRARGRGADDTAVIDDYAVDPISGSTGMRTQLVTVRRAGEVA
ncbi:MAG TPA: molybdopterin dinucleotide binding domain-containing protein, partial [Anaeromyxobacteraceae bacterium]|nr:molybdopterin dinucleotide binding domain-containing protein [Anaeromyxobacteraceae bacterium]